MKTKIIIAFLTLALSVFAESERIIVVKDSDNMSPVTTLLSEGWTVKHQSVATAIARYGMFNESRELLVFTLTPPLPEVLEAAAEAARIRREEEFARKREEYLAKKKTAK